MAREPSGRSSAQPRERYGELAIERYVKDDGRALILYWLDRPPSQADEPDGGARAAGERHERGQRMTVAAERREPGQPDAGPSDRSEPGQPDAGPSEQPEPGQADGDRDDDARREQRETGLSELRFDELRDEQVVYAIDRQERTFLPPADHCPLCPTAPGAAPTEIPFAHFEIAVFENRFPALRAPHGAAEVVVYSADHDGSLGTLAPARATALMWVWRHRYLELGARTEVDYVLAFENRGVEVGVTLHHPHGQIYAYPFLPPVPKLELEADARLRGCAQCELLGRELGDGRRIVLENDAIVAYVPYAARWAYEVHVVMRAHRPSLLECEPPELDGLAAGLQALVRGYDRLFDRPFPYVMAVHQAPTDGRGKPTNEHREPTDERHEPPSDRPELTDERHELTDERRAAVGGRARGHAHVEFYPPLRTATKLKYLAGSEQGAGTFISDTLPEESARALREAIDRDGAISRRTTGDAGGAADRGNARDGRQ